jgi:hypothetical protein
MPLKKIAFAALFCPVAESSTVEKQYQLENVCVKITKLYLSPCIHFSLVSELLGLVVLNPLEDGGQDLRPS